LLDLLRSFKDVGFYAKEINGNHGIVFRENELFYTVSCFKVITAIALYHKFESEGLSDTKEFCYSPKDKSPGSGILKNMKPHALSFYNYVFLMLKLSDNTATDILLRLIGKSYQDKIIRKLGLKKTRLPQNLSALCAGEYSTRKRCTPEEFDAMCIKGKAVPIKNCPTFQLSKGNVSTPFEMVKVLEELIHPKLISKKAANKILGIMKMYDADDRILEFGSYMEIANKGGWMRGVRSDIGIVFSENPFYYAIMGKNLSNPEKQRLISSYNDILKMTMRCF